MHVLTRARSYLAHAPGAGKTCEAIVAALMLPEREGQVVFIVPPGLTVNWEREIHTFTRDHRAYPTIGVVGRTASQRSVAWRAEFLIIPDSMLTKGWVYRRLFGVRRIRLLAVDEASRFKDPASARAKALFGGSTRYITYPGLVRHAERVVLLDGSPMPNRPMELWAPVYALDPEAIDCMSQRDFGFRYCGATQNYRGEWQFLGSSHEEELRERIRQRLFHVVTEDQLDHPERRRSILVMSQDVRSASLKAWEKRNLKLLRTLEDNPAEDLSQGEIASARRELGILKTPWVTRYILQRLEDQKNEKILLFAWHREVCQALSTAIAARLGRDRVSLVIGGTPEAERERAFASFQSGTRGSVQVIIGNIQAMGRGHNLQRADRVVFAEASWSDELNKQCEKRASRRGRDKDLFVRCEYVAAPDSLDERVLRSLFTKAGRVRRVIG